MAKTIHVHFEHGLGDSANFARMIPLYTKRGWNVRISTSPDKAWLFRAAGAEVVERGGAWHGWDYPDHATDWENAARDWAGNKNGGNLSRAPLPDIGRPDVLWPEYCRPFEAVLPFDAAVRERVRRATGALPRPLVLLHTIGNTNQYTKSLPAEAHGPFFRGLLDRCDGTLLVLDWDGRVPVFPHARLRTLRDLFGAELPDLETLCALIDEAGVLIGVDSGPLHLAGLTDTPRVGLWRDGHYPSTYLLPIVGGVPGQELHLVGKDKRDWNRRGKRLPFAIAETDWSAEDLAQLCLAPLDPDPIPPQIRQFLAWCRGTGGGGISEYRDRHIGFRKILEHAPLREAGHWVETGTIRMADDWAGAGYSTYLFGAVLQACGKGHLTSIDSSPESCVFARWECRRLPRVEIVEALGEDGIRRFGPGEIDLLYLDSCDTEHPAHADVCLAEAQAAVEWEKVSPAGLIAIDDSPFAGGAWQGKGAKAVPWLLERGWRIVYAGYQCVLQRK